MGLGLVVLTHLGIARMTPIFGLFGTYGNAYLDQYVEDIDPHPPRTPTPLPDSPNPPPIRTLRPNYTHCQCYLLKICRDGGI